MARVAFNEEFAARLNEEEIEMCKKAFHMYDKNGSGTIDVKELRMAMESLGQHPTDEDLYLMISQVDEDGSNEIDFGEFMHAIMMNKTMTAHAVNEEEVLDAWTAVGGNGDTSGGVSISKLQGILTDFDLRVDVAEIVGSSKPEIDYEEFKALLS